jgi:predicted DNA-binding transcriptional regulator YafY
VDVLSIRQHLNRNATIRIFKIHNLIENKHYPNIQALARQLEVNARTIERDIEQLRDFFNAPLVYDRLHKGYYYEGKFTLPPFQFTEGEMVVLFLGQKLLSQFEGTIYQKEIQSLSLKLQCLLNSEPCSTNFLLDDIVSFNIAPLRGEDWRVAKFFAWLQNAIQCHNKVKMLYYSITTGETRERTVSPYHLRYYDGAWYLIAYCYLRNAPRIFAIDRIESLEVLPEKYYYPDDFQIEEFLDGVRGIVRGKKYQVEIKFDAFQAKWIKEKKRKSFEEIRELPDGGLIFKSEVSGLTEVKQWVLSFGYHVEVIKPEELRTEISEEIKKLQQIYR